MMLGIIYFCLEIHSRVVINLVILAFNIAEFRNTLFLHSSFLEFVPVVRCYRTLQQFMINFETVRCYKQQLDTIRNCN